MHYVDLHIHTMASGDGRWEIRGLLQEAQSMNLAAIAITDHDTVKGAVKALKIKDDYKVDVISGIEFNTYFENESIHILGYLIDVENSKLLREAEKQSTSRRRRAEKILERLEEHDIYITMKRLTEIANDNYSLTTICFAILEEKKEEGKEAFNRAWDEYLDEKRGKAFVKREKIGTLEAIETILNSGGIPVMAHPIKLNDQELIPYFVKKGMIGIEVYYPEHGEETEQHYLEMSRKYDLVATGGSDSHGPGSVKPLDVGCANVPLSVYEDLKKIKKNL